MRRALILSVALLLVPGAAGSTEIVRIGMSLALSGKYAEMGIMQEKGFRLWEKDVNARGGLLGKRVSLVIRDDRSDPASAKAIYTSLIDRERVDLVFAPYSSELTEAIQPIAEKHGYPLLISGASSDSLWGKGYRNSFGVYTPANRYASGFLELLVMNGIGEVAVVAVDDAFSKSLFEGTKTWAKRFGLELVFLDVVRKGTKDLEPVARKARDSGASVLIVCGHFEESVAMRLALKRIGWQPRAYFASVGPVMQAFHDRLKGDANLVFSSSQWESHPGLKLPGARDFTAAFTSSYGESPSYHAATAYAAGQILEAAVRKARSLDREKIRNMLATMDTSTIIGRYGVDATGMQVRHFPLIVQWQSGKREIVWPKEVSTAAPIFPKAGKGAR